MSTPLFKDRVKETTGTTGTGALSLGGTSSTFRTFVSGFGDGNRAYYAIVNRAADEWEVGYGTITAGSPDILTRDRILASSNGDAVVDFSTGTKDVWGDGPATIWTHARRSNRETYTQSSHGFSVGNVIRHNGTIWVKAQADSEANSRAQGVVEYVNGNDFTVVFSGYISITAWGLTGGSPYYLDASTAGAITTTAPVFKKPILIALSATEALVDIQTLVNLYKNIAIPSIALWPSGTNGCGPLSQRELSSNKVNVQVLEFDQTSKEYAEVNFIMSDDWNGGSIYAKLVWTAASGSGGVRWGIQARSYADDDALDQAYGTAQEVTDTLLATDDAHITGETTAITPAGSPAGGQMLQIRVYRDPAHGDDTLTADAQLMGIRIKYQITGN